ncbi:LacI family DNA-binding transcriptional regulator [Paludibacterium yongneupense]|uniref:LacI family DNA-binding transcriptional regulator n=1 Tax=Paludibacterium yongneupense TaxID=400061 RepID=UPI00048EBCA7|nr:LacI family DNA-binding transcriptional regulator [Paludibacterium yongneupense]
MTTAKPPSSRTGKITIRDVACDAGVSKTSISRYLGGELSALSDRTRERIEQSIARLGYRPSQMARALKAGRTRLIGMLVADVLNPYSVAVLHGAEALCRARGYTLVLCNTGNDDACENLSLQALRSYNVEGLIVHTLGTASPLLAEIVAGGLPVVLVDRRLRGIEADLVGLDNAAATAVAARHLVQGGFSDIAWVSESVQGVSSREDRHAAFLSELAAQPAARGRVIELPHLEDNVALDTALRAFAGDGSGQRKALLAASGVVTLQLVLAMRRLGLALPDDLGLLGFDELPWASVAGPGISTLAQPTDAIGHAAMSCLFERIAGDRQPPREILFPGHLIARGSTAI